MERSGMKFPESIDELLSIFKSSEEIEEERIFHCRGCSSKHWYKDMRGIQYTPKRREPVRDDFWYYCTNCLDHDNWQFIISNNIDVTILSLKELRNIQDLYYNGKYDKWLDERESKLD